MKKIIFGITILSVSVIAEANSVESGDLGIKLGTLGVGLDYSIPFSEDLAFRIGINKYTYGSNGTESDIDYDIDLDLQSLSLLVDYRPNSNGFLITGGLLYNQNELTFDGKPTNASYNINNVTYSTADIGSLNGSVDFNKIAPYFGIGYKGKMTQSGDWTLTAELGVIYQGDPNASLNAQCGSALTISQCQQLQADVSQEQKELQDSIDGYSLYPVLSIGIAYKF